jgi:hypothetical protein
MPTTRLTILLVGEYMFNDYLTFFVFLTDIRNTSTIGGGLPFDSLSCTANVTTTINPANTTPTTNSNDG